MQAIKFLVANTGVDVKALNTNGSTASDILIQSPRDLRDMDIENLFHGDEALTPKDTHSIVHDWVPTQVPRITTSPTSTLISTEKPAAALKQKHTDWLGRKRSALMVVASLIATVAFQTGITPPGGVWNPVEKPHAAGTSVMVHTNSFRYGQFMIFNTIAFLASLSIILLLISGLPMKHGRWMWIQMVIMWIAITAQVLTYFISLKHTSPESANVQSMLSDVTEISVLTWLALMGVVFVGNVVRMNSWILRKYGFLGEKEVVPEETIEDEHEEL